MFVTADQLICHIVGDYLLQSEYCALEKTKKSVAAFVHAVLYTIPFIFVTQKWYSLLMICISHFLIDRWRLARYVCWAKNFLAPRWIEVQGDTKRLCNLPWVECSTTGYTPGTPEWMSTWLMIIIDNCIHILINALAIKYG
jgi:hypothetical protein